jgi:molybdenum cofactor cytidylyltransferase
MIAAVVPAAGASVRMGRPKLLIEIHGQSLIGRVVSALRAGGAGRVVVVAPPADAVEGPEIAAQARKAGALVIVPGTRPAEMRDSIELGLEWLAKHDSPRSVVLTPGDYPGITPEIVAQLLEFAARLPDRVVLPSYNGRRGHPIVLPWKIAVEVRSLPAGAGINALVARHPYGLVELALSEHAVVADLDTPEDLERWEERQERLRVQVRFFALAKDRAGRSEVEIELAGGSKVADLRAVLAERFPALGPLLATALIAVNEEYAGDDALISPGSRLAVIPPVSGGTGDCSRVAFCLARQKGAFRR